MPGSIATSIINLGRHLAVLLGINAALGLADMVVSIVMLTFIAKVRVSGGGQDLEIQGDMIDRVSLAVTQLALLVNLATMIVWLIWQYRLARAPQLNRAYVTSSPGWQLGAWFVPLVSLVVPAHHMGQLGKALAARAGKPAVAPWVILLPWWISFLAHNMLGTASAQLLRRAGEDIDKLEFALRIDVVSSLATVAAAVLGALVVVTYTRLAKVLPEVIAPMT